MGEDQVVISLQNVSKNFILRHNHITSLKSYLISIIFRRGRANTEVFQALTNVNLKVGKGESVALAGNNGSGKSTLLQIIAGIIPPTTGHVHTHGIIAPLIRLGVGMHPELTGEENIFLNASTYGLKNEHTRSMIGEIVEFAELGSFIDTPIKNYSSGMYVRLGFSVAVHLKPSILLADEILAVGDSKFKQKCYDKITELRKQGLTLILVSHSEGQMKQFCQRYVRLESGRIVDQGSL